MGDRCNCTLVIGGILKHEHFSYLADALEDAGVAEFDEGKTQIINALSSGTDTFEFEEVNYAQMDNDLGKVLAALKLSYTWRNGSGGSYGEGIEIYDARISAWAEYVTSNGYICLTLTEIDKEGAIETARKWDKFITEMKFMPIISNHDLVAKEAAGQLPEGYLPLLSQIDLSPK